MQPLRQDVDGGPHAVGSDAFGLLQRLSDCVTVELDPDLTVRSLDGHLTRLPFTPQQIVGKTWWHAIGHQNPSNPRIAAHVQALEARRAFRDFPLAFVCRERGAFHYLASGAPVYDSAGFRGYAIVLRDVTEIEKFARAHRSLDRILSAVTENCPALVVLKDVDGRYVNINRRAAQIYGISAEAAIGKLPAEVLPPEAAAMCTALDNDVLEHEESHETEQAFWSDGRRHIFFTQKFPIHDDMGCLTGIGAIGTDVSELRAVSDDLYRQTHYDALTGLPSRALVKERLDRAMISARRGNAYAAVVVIGIASGRSHNDAFGRAVNNSVFAEIGTRLLACVRESDTVGRLSADEFCLVLTDLNHAADIDIVTQKVLAALGKPMAAGETNVGAVAHIGSAVHPADAADADGLLQNASLAMFLARRAGVYAKRFVPAMIAEVYRLQRLSDGLLTACLRGEFHLVYQPIVEAESGRVVGAEALIRWQHPELGRIGPDEFISLAEEHGVIGEIGAWVMRTACTAAQSWRGGMGRDLSVAVNVSVRQLADPQFVALVETCLTQSGLPPELLKIEITESALAADVGEIRRVLEQLKALGVDLSLDDFGTGYSALSYLSQFPFDILKIDRAFIRDVADSRLAGTLAESIIQMARRLGIRVIAEGVETETQLQFLRARGCEMVQGYLLSSPLKSDVFVDYARTRISSIAA